MNSADSTLRSRQVGRPSGATRRELMRVLAAGVCGTFEALASHAQVPPGPARRTLYELCREGAAAAQGVERQAQRAGRPRVVYSLPQSAANDAPFDPLTFARQVWR